jgi:hypothetical protein
VLAATAAMAKFQFWGPGRRRGGTSSKKVAKFGSENNDSDPPIESIGLFPWDPPGLAGTRLFAHLSWSLSYHFTHNRLR